MTVTKARRLYDPLGKCNNPTEYEPLTETQKQALAAFIAAHIRPARSLCSLSSYGMKHVFEGQPGGFYVTNGQFKGAMLAAGYRPVDKNALNWRYRARMVQKRNASDEDPR